MRSLTVNTFLTLDGVMQAPGGPGEDDSGGFAHGGWSVNYWDDRMGQVMGEAMGNPFALVLGRRTYDIFAAYWPYQDDAIARAFNPATKYVATHRPESLSWQNSQALGPDIVAALRRIRQEDGPDLLIQGSGNLIQTLLANDLIDEMTVLTFPLLLGAGKRLFEGGAAPRALKLARSAVSGTGVIVATYERGGQIRPGSFVSGQPSEAELERRRTWK